MDKLIIDEWKERNGLSNTPLPGETVAYLITDVIRIPQLNFNGKTTFQETLKGIVREATAWVKGVKVLEYKRGKFKYVLTVVTVEDWKVIPK